MTVACEDVVGRKIAGVNQNQLDALNRLDSMLTGEHAEIKVRGIDRNGNVKEVLIESIENVVLPAEFAELLPDEVEDLYVRDCPNLTDVSRLHGMRNLKYLSLSDLSSIRVLPRIVSLNGLRVSRCEQFNYAASLVHYVRDPGFRKFCLVHGALEHLPLEIFLLSNLHYLKLGDCNNVTRIPNELGNLVLLEELFIQGHRILSVPPTIGRLRLLKRLNLNGLGATVVPDEIGQLVDLQQVSFFRCTNLRHLPSGLLKLPKLEKLELGCCDSLTVPEADIMECTDSLLRYNERFVFVEKNLVFMNELFCHMRNLNRAGRLLLRRPDVPLALWSLVLGRCRNSADCLFFFLKQKPVLTSEPSIDDVRSLVVLLMAREETLRQENSGLQAEVLRLQNELRASEAILRQESSRLQEEVGRLQNKLREVRKRKRA